MAKNPADTDGEGAYSMSAPQRPARENSPPLPPAAGPLPAQPPLAQPQPAAGQVVRPQTVPARPMPVGQPRPIVPGSNSVPGSSPAPLPPQVQPTAQPQTPAQPQLPMPAVPGLPPAANAAAAASSSQPASPAHRPSSANRPQVLRPQVVQRSDNTVIRERAEDDPANDEELTQQILRKSTPMLVSMVIHMVLLIVLGLWAYSKAVHYDIQIVASADGPEDMFDSIAALASPDNSIDVQSAPVVTTVTTSNPFASVTAPPIDPFGTSAPQVKVEGALGSRSEAAQEYMVGKRGGSRASQSAVGNGLKWLADRQDKSRGFWRLQGHDRRDGVELVINENPQAATAMALLAFQGAGHTHKSGRYSDNVARGLKFIMAQQTSEGNFCSTLRPDEAMYAHAQCTIVVCELLAMTRDEALRNVAEKAVKYCIAAQDQTLGGWRYRPGYDSDISVTGWMLVALKSATYAGIEVPDEVFNNIGKYLDSVTQECAMNFPEIEVAGKVFKAPEGVLYGYQQGTKPTNTMTAEAILMRQYMGWAQDDPRINLASDILLNGFMPNWEERDVYYWYYATQMFSHLEGKPWEKWNGAMRDMIVKKQVTADSQKGSWDPLGSGSNKAIGADFWCANGAGGRHYVTCMSLYILEVYYRHMPIYSIKGRDKTAR